jgi:phenylalanyl-tRNA synthetase beta subunit
LETQQAEITVEGERIGVMGIIHPEVLQNFGWLHPAAAF